MTTEAGQIEHFGFLHSPNGPRSLLGAFIT